MPVTYVIGDVAGVVESPVYAILKMNQALAKLDTREFGGDGAPLKIYNAVLPFTDQQPAMKWDGEWHITIEVFRDLGTGVRRRAGADLHFDGRLVPVVPHAADCDGGDSVFAHRRFAGARFVARIFHRHFHDRLHGGRGHRGAQFHHPRGLHRTCGWRKVIRWPRRWWRRAWCGSVPSCSRRWRWWRARAVILADPIFQGLAIALMAGRLRFHVHRAGAGAAALLHGLQP